MSTFRVHKTKDFTVMSNSHLREHSMSLKAKGLLTLMLSLPDDWDYSVQGLSALNKDGKDSIMATLDELQSFGYLNMTPCRDSKGRYITTYDVYESPNRESRCGKPESGNPQQYNTNNDYIPTTSSSNNNLNNIKINTKQDRKIKKELDLSFVSIHFADVFNKWLEYKKERKQSYTQIGAESCYRKLIELSNNDPYTADKIVEQSIANNYQGLFALKENGNSSGERRMSLGQALGEMLRNGGCPMPHNQ